MGSMTTFDGQPGYAVTSDSVRVSVTVRGGHLTARFRAGSAEVSPFFVAPWRTEAVTPGLPPMLEVLRGDFFCMPFGDPDHGPTANEPWELVGARVSGAEHELSLRMDIGAGRVEKKIRVVDGSPVIYQEHVVTGLDAEMPLGHHPILQLPRVEGAGIIDMSPPRAGFTAPKPVEVPSQGGYSRLAIDRPIADRTRVPTIDGATVDITRYPTPIGWEDLVMFVSDPSLPFAFTSVAVPSEGWLYFQLKDPRSLAETVFWMSNGGRHYAPWSGRIVGVLGVEEVTSYFAYGAEASAGPNPVRAAGWATAVRLTAEQPTAVRLIMGVVPIGPGFKGVADIERKDGGAVRIRGRGGETIDVPCAVDFLRT
jgi:hypothetical protein